MGDQSMPQSAEAFIGREDGMVPEGEVLDDLQGEGMEATESGDEGDDHGEAGGAAAPVEDDSIQSFEGHQDAVLAVAWSPAHRDLVATGGQDDVAFIWRVGQDALEETAGTLSTLQLNGHTDSVVSVAFNLTGTLLATGSMDGTVKVWNTADGALVQTLEGPGGPVEWVRWHPKGNVVLAGAEDFTVWMWMAQTGTCMQVFSGHSGPVTAGGFTPDGKAVVTAGGDDDCSMRVWNPKTGECTTFQRHPFHEQGLTSLAVHPDSSMVITGAQDGSVRMTNIHTNRMLGSLTGHEESVEAVGFSAHLPLAVSAGVDGKMFIWDCSTLSQRGECAHPEAVTRLAWHPLQPLVVSASLDGVARCWDLRTSQCIREFGGHADGVQDVAFSPDGSMFITGSDDGTARIFALM